MVTRYVLNVIDMTLQMIEALAHTYPNDADLGREIRKMCKNYNEHVEHIYKELDEAFDVTKYFPRDDESNK